MSEQSWMSSTFGTTDRVVFPNHGQAALWKSACDTLREVCKRRLQANTYVYSNLISICGRELNWHRALSLIKDGIWE